MEAHESDTIMIVDDTPENLFILMECLSRSNFKTLIAKSGEGALRQLDFAKPDIILLDIMMPGIDGYETCRRLKEREDTKDIPVIFVTALTDTVDKVKGFKTGAVDYITKPFQHEEVLARVRTHLTIQHQKKQLMKLNATKDKFFSIIAHDLRSPFNALIPGTKFLADSIDKLSSEQVKRFALEIHRSAETTFNLLGNLLSWARSQSGVFDYDPVTIDLCRLIINTIDIHRQQADQKKIRFKTCMEAGISVYADMNMINTVLRNLISNAIKFTDEGGQVTVSAVTESNRVKIKVADTGIGITQKNLPRLFEIDGNLKMRGTAGEKGTGLGLILCREFIEKHKGAIWTESKPGCGTTFFFTLPADTLEK